MLHRFARRLKEIHEEDGGEKGFTLIELLIVILLRFHKRSRRPEPRPS